jgi:hypothetical protein
LLFLAWQANVYVADLDASGNHITTPRQFTATAGRNFPAAWTADSKSLVLESYRDRRWLLLKQPLDRDSPEQLVTVTDQTPWDRAGEWGMSTAQGRLSPDGAWVIYAGPYGSAGGFAGPYQMMRVPVTGGRPIERSRKR